jgi:zinc protease
MKRTHLPLLLSLGLILGNFTPTASAIDWAHEQSDLKADSKAVWGKLENGLRYVIYPNKYPVAKRASMRLYINAGSLMEEDDQQGMAHFLEHMAFNGSKNFAAGTMVERFQRMGMGFGADTNAHTSFKETVYKLEVPRVDEGMLNEALTLFRDDLDGMLLGDNEIDRERGIILSEKLARDSVETRIMEDSYNFSLPDALIPKRMPIGLEDTIKGMKRQRFVDFYQKWYTPKRATLVVVGDVEIPLVEGMIKKLFASTKPAAADSPDPDLGRITKGRGLIAKLHTEMEAPTTDISIEALSEASKDPDSAAKRRIKMVRGLADSMLNQRFSLLAKAEGSPFMEAEAYNFEMFKFVSSSGVGVKCKPEQWQAALSVAEQELRRALEHGFTAAEFAEAKASLLQAARLRAEQSDTRKNADLSNGLVQAIADDRVVTDPADDLKRIGAALDTVTPEECVASLRAAWKMEDINIFVGGNLKLENAPEKIIAAYKESQKTPVAAPKKEDEGTFAYTNFGAPGTVASRKEVADLGITQVVFANNVRLNIKKTDFDKNAIRVVVGLGGGKLEAPADKPGIIPLAQSIFHAGGLEKHSVDDLRRLFASKTVGNDFIVGDESFLLAGKTTPTDLTAQLQLLCANVVAPGYREEAERQFKKGLDAVYTELEHTAEGVMQNKVVGFIHSDDVRFVFPERGLLEKLTTADVKAWLDPVLKDSYMEVSVVGDVEPETAIKAVAETLGALGKRAEKKADFTAQRKVTMPKEPKDRNFEFTTQIPRSYALAYWPTTDMFNIQRTRRLSVLGQILDDRLRLKIREELGDSYSPASYHVPSDTYSGYGYMTAMATLKPDQVAIVKPMFLDIANAIAKEGISDDEFQRALEPMLQQLQQMRRDNKYWSMNVLRNCQEHPERLDWARSFESDFRSIKKEELQALAKQYLVPDQALVIGLLPHEAKQ